MEIKLCEISIAEITDQFVDNEEEGVGVNIHGICFVGGNSNKCFTGVCLKWGTIEKCGFRNFSSVSDDLTLVGVRINEIFINRNRFVMLQLTKIFFYVFIFFYIFYSIKDCKKYNYGAGEHTYAFYNFI